MAGVTDVRDAADAAAAVANFDIDPIPGPVFRPLLNAQPAAPPAMAVPVRFRPDNRFLAAAAAAAVAAALCFLVAAAFCCWA